MTKKEKAKYIVDELEKLFPETPIPLDHKDPYTLMIAVLLSAQCTDERVNKVTPLLFKRASTPAEMIQLSVEEIRAIIRPCGLSPKKSQAIYDLSHMLLNQFNGEVPANYEDLESFPGVGHKTASVVMSQAFGFPAFPVDTHIQRLLKNWGISKSNNVVVTEREAKAIFPEKLWNKLHLQIIFYGRAYSPARSPKKDIDYITRTIGTRAAISGLK
jgi:endonuclease-3